MPEEEIGTCSYRFEEDTYFVAWVRGIVTQAYSDKAKALREADAIAQKIKFNEAYKAAVALRDQAYKVAELLRDERYEAAEALRDEVYKLVEAVRNEVHKLVEALRDEGCKVAELLPDKELSKTGWQVWRVLRDKPDRIVAQRPNGDLLERAISSVENALVDIGIEISNNSLGLGHWNP